MAAALAVTLPTLALAATVTGDAAGGTYSSSVSGENAILVSGKTVKLSGITVTKTGDSSGDSADFYGTNAAVLAKNGAALTLTGAKITSDGAHANAVFSYGTGTTVNISDSTIVTSGNNSGGIMTTGGAVMNADGLTVTTSGNSSAAIRSDRGGGDVNVTGGTCRTSGVGSPAIYSTADIDVSNAALTSAASEAVVIEGGNSVSLNGCTVTGDHTRTNGQSSNLQNVLIYQSASGDASEGSASFEMTGGSLTAQSGDQFRVTNTTAAITLSGVTLSGGDSLLSVQADAWGTSGSNGGNATLNAAAQTLSGAITVDSLSTLNLILSDGSAYTGAINAGGAAGSVYAAIPAGCTWTLTGDSYVTSLSCGASAIVLNGHTLYVDGTAYTAGTVSAGTAVSGSTAASGQTTRQPQGGQTAGAPSENQMGNGRPDGTVKQSDLDKYIEAALRLGILPAPDDAPAGEAGAAQSSGAPAMQRENQPSGQPDGTAQNSDASAPAQSGTSAEKPPERTVKTGDVIRMAAVLHDLLNGGSLADFDLTSDDETQFMTYAVAKGIVKENAYTDMTAEMSESDALAILTAAVPADQLESIVSAAMPARQSAADKTAQPAQQTTQPTQKAAQPTTQAAQPTTQATQPTQQTTQPTAQATQPTQKAAQQTQKTTQTTQPAQQPAQTASAQQQTTQQNGQQNQMMGGRQTAPQGMNGGSRQPSGGAGQTV